MDGATSGSSERSGSLKATVNFFRGTIPGKKQGYHPGDIGSKSRELHRVKLDKVRLDDNLKATEREKAQAESELNLASSAVKEFGQQIDESIGIVNVRRPELQSLRKSERTKEEGSPLDGNSNDQKYVEVLQELDHVQQELSQLKLHAASALEAKAKAEKEIEALNSKATSYESSLEALRKEIEETTEEKVLVELARMEAEREHTEIEAQRRAEATQFPKFIEAAKKWIKDLRGEISRAKELEMKLAVTTSDVNVLQNEMELLRAMEKNFQKNRLEKDSNKIREEEKESSYLLESAEDELKAAKEEFASIQEEGFHFMASMDLVREELGQLAKETERLKTMKKEADSTVHNLNSKLRAAKSKLESATMADEKVKALVSNLSVAVQQLQTEIEAAKFGKELTREETKAIRSEIEKTDSSIDSVEKRLQAATKELEAVKASEAIALKKLKKVRERTMRERLSSSLKGSTVTLSKSEYDYLSRRGAAAAQKVADKKVEASKAWIEALKAREKETLMRIEQAKMEIKELRVVEEQEEVRRAEKTLVARKTMEQELRDWRQIEQEALRENLQLTVARPRKSMRNNGMRGAKRRVKVRRIAASSGTRYHARSPSVTIKNKKSRKVMRYLLKFLQGPRNE